MLSDFNYKEFLERQNWGKHNNISGLLSQLGMMDTKKNTDKLLYL